MMDSKAIDSKLTLKKKINAVNMGNIYAEDLEK
jgi:hypothetical protein